MTKTKSDKELDKFKIITLVNIGKVQDRLVQLMELMKEGEADYDEFSAILDLYRTLTQVIEL